MSLSAGTRLGPYEILCALGVGGMGEVYRAQDTRLDRTVAIKVLPAQFAAEPDRLRRFEEEARAIASLNHPYICQIYDIGPGYLVLEYIDGTPPQGPLAPDEAVRLGLQIVSAPGGRHAMLAMLIDCGLRQARAARSPPSCRLPSYADSSPPTWTTSVGRVHATDRESA
jgi:serine/threonine protein kinase